MRMTRRSLIPAALSIVAGAAVGAVPVMAASPSGKVYTKAEVEQAEQGAWNHGWEAGETYGRARHLDEHVASAVIVGALYDFMGWLTTRDEPITVGREVTIYAVMESFTAWAAARGLDINRGDVMNWRARLEGKWVYVGDLDREEVAE